jgi:lipoprotein-anchoring transpeptidase ErfK/SrfK
MNAAAFARRAALLVGATAVLVLSGGLAWAAVNDYSSRDIVPPGVSVAGTDLSGMTAADARVVIEKAVSDPVKRPVEVTAAGKTFTFDPAGAVTVDTQAMLDEAMAPRRGAPFVARLRADLADGVLPAEVTPRYSVDATAMATFLEKVRKQTDAKPKDASVTGETGKLVVTHAKNGKKLDVAGAQKAIEAAFSAEKVFSSGDRKVEVTVKTLKPKVGDDDLGHTIIVSRSKKTLVLYDGVKVEKKYQCAVGTPQFPTPLGHWEIVNKQFMPAWYNPGSDWAKGMPKVIPPGPSNPLGTRALALNASGVLIHGTTKDGSIGTAASHGCMRMHMWDVEDLFPRVEVGTQVYIVP